MKNNWCVITGGPSSGKSAVINKLRDLGYKTYDEMARIYIDKEITKGRTIKEIRGDELSFQKIVLRLKIELENKLKKRELIFLERGIPDSLAYYELCGVLNDPYLLKVSRKSNYKKIFLLEMVEFFDDYARVENERQAIVIEKLLEENYRFVGFNNIIKVPKMPVEDRVNYILNKI